MSEELIRVEPMSIDQLAGSVVLVLGAVGTLLLVIWQSRCHCKFRIGCSDECNICMCERKPPSQDEINHLKEEQESGKPDLGPVAKANLERDRNPPRLSTEEETLVPQEPEEKQK